MSDAALDRIQTLARSLELSDEYLQGSDEVADRLRRMSVTFGELPKDEPWLRAWLEREHVKAAMLFTAAKTNYRKWSGAPNAEAKQARDSAIRCFEDWKVTLVQNIDAYVASSRTQDVVRAWHASADAFFNNPTNPGSR
ncbi:hypothetical protein [Curtobacterium sp. ZW137]|uniref:hypothetical protein n=1 Tax=Curtobacterium sp. ZW137 TaxID=2485104 RepID=UPI000F4BBAC8|nr:hypothetical protein [Curtobacterium sp. ZW137]ROP65634.1 hypothetical protein EDF55_0071 [Curtobacterium sp. ZW137]